MVKTIVLFYLICCIVFAEDSDKTLTELNEKSHIINKASEAFNINPLVLAAIIFTERSMNYDWSDAALDVVIAKRGYNSSIGFCQIKLKTAYWIELQLNDTSSVFFPGGNYALFEISASPDRLIEKLQKDSLNILYAAAYIRIIQSYWEKMSFPLNDRPEIVGTLYSIGLFKEDGMPRAPHQSPKANLFGKKVKDNLKILAPIIN